MTKEKQYPQSFWRRRYDATTSYRMTFLDFSKVKSPMKNLENRKFKI